MSETKHLVFKLQGEGGWKMLLNTGENREKKTTPDTHRIDAQGNTT